MPDLASARIIEAQLSLAETLLPIFAGGAIAILMTTLLCLWELCWQTRERHRRR